MSLVNLADRALPGVTRRRLLLGGVPGLAGCTYSLLPDPQDSTALYSLTPEPRFPDDLPSVGWQLVVERPTAAAGIDGSRIALYRDPYTLDYYAGAAWSDNAPGMLRSLLIDAFERTGKIAPVGTETDGFKPDYVLKSDLREFQAEYRGSDAIPSVVVRMSAKLIALPDRRIARSIAAEKSVRASGSHFANVLSAFNEALGAVLQDIVVATLTVTPPAVG